MPGRAAIGCGLPRLERGGGVEGTGAARRPVCLPWCAHVPPLSYPNATLHLIGCKRHHIGSSQTDGGAAKQGPAQRAAGARGMSFIAPTGRELRPLGPSSGFLSPAEKSPHAGMRLKAVCAMLPPQATRRPSGQGGRRAAGQARTGAVRWARAGAGALPAGGPPTHKHGGAELSFKMHLGAALRWVHWARALGAPPHAKTNRQTPAPSSIATRARAAWRQPVRRVRVWARGVSRWPEAHASKRRALHRPWGATKEAAPPKST